METRTGELLPMIQYSTSQILRAIFMIKVLFTGAAYAPHCETSFPGMKLGVYVVPGGFIADENKTILGTNITIGSVCSGDNGLARCNWNFGQDGVQQWHDSVVAQFAEW